MLWAALLLPPAAGTVPSSNALQGVALWALQFTPRVAISEDTVLLEVAASVRLFGGKRALRDRVVEEGRAQGVIAFAWASNSLAAQALARAGIENGFKRPLAELLDALPMNVLSAVAPHESTLARLGCRTLGDLRRLPRGGISRRFGKELLSALDRAHGLIPETHVWVELPETFAARLELLSRVELAPALLFGARRLLLQMCGWLAARHCGVTAFTLHWKHDSMRASAVGDGGELTIRTANCTRDLEHLCRLLAEHLANLTLQAPVAELQLLTTEVSVLQTRSASLLPDEGHETESLQRVLERIAARLGPQQVLRPLTVDDHRPEWMQRWCPADASAAHQRNKLSLPLPPPLPAPSWLLPQPLQLATRNEQPLYQGALQLLAGPHRVEGGWWHRTDSQHNAHVSRDYWVALSERAGVLWIFQQRLAGDQTAWYLHGVFA